MCVLPAYARSNRIVSDAFSEKLDELVSPGTSGSDVKTKGTPEKWRPNYDLGPEGGYVVSEAFESGSMPGADQILKDNDLDPEEWSIVSLRKGRWQVWGGEYLEAVKLNVVPRKTHTSLAPARDFDLEKLVDEIKAWTPPAVGRIHGGAGAYMFAPSDQQLGKKTGSGGTEQSVRRILESTELGVQRLYSLRKAGLQIGTVAIPLPGDHVEGNTSQGGRLQSPAGSDLGQTEQVRVARRLLLQQIKAFAPLAEEIIVPVVNGNHDEVTRQVTTDPADGWNVEIAAAVQDACAENPNLQHVKFRYPERGHQTLTVDICGTNLGLFHGHQFSRDIEKYLSGQSLGDTALGRADIWLSGHYHNFRSQDIGDRFWVQAPTTDPGSEWYRDRTGMNSKPGVLTMVIGGSFDPREHIGVIPVA